MYFVYQYLSTIKGEISIWLRKTHTAKTTKNYSKFIGNRFHLIRSVSNSILELPWILSSPNKGTNKGTVKNEL